MSVFDSENNGDHTKALAFLDPNGGVTIQRYETMKYRQFDKLTEKQLGYFWRPQEIDISKDGADFKALQPHEKHIFTSNLKRQILLDSVQGRAPTAAFGPIVSLPEIEAWLNVWTFSELIHSKSYTYIIQNVYANSSVIFDEMMDIQEIVDCAKDISFNYDNLVTMTLAYQLLGVGEHTITTRTRDLNGEVIEENTRNVEVSLYELKKALWLAIMSVNILEGIRFYASFAASWNFAENKKMVGNSSIIRLIARDESLHLASTQTLLKILPQDDPDYAKIAVETKDQSIKLFTDAVEQEKAWIKYIFQYGSMIGLNEQLLSEYIEWLANKRLTAVGLPQQYKTGSNPLPWTQKWISGSDVQVAPQEMDITSYEVAAVNLDMTEDTFKGFSL